jgi:hypothetical protein
MLTELDTSDALDTTAIHHHTVAPPVPVPPGHIGPVVLPGSGKLIWWTGRVAIGLRHQPKRHYEAIGQSAVWLQDLMLNSKKNRELSLA